MSSRCPCSARLPRMAPSKPRSTTSGSRTATRLLHSTSRSLQPAASRATGSSGSSSYQGAQVDENATELRRKMFAWLHGPGRKLRQPLKGSTNYLNAYDARGNLIRQSDRVAAGAKADTSKRNQVDNDDQLNTQPEQDRRKKETGDGSEDLPPETVEDLRPYPLNRHFRSQPVLSEAFREEIWRRVTQEEQDIQLISSSMGVSVERVAAVVRLKGVEKRWEQEGTPLATPYSKAVMAMLPTTPFDPAKPLVGHESINDLQVATQTKTQIFHPVSETRAFTRTDAGKAFDDELLPADERIPHPELVLTERDRLSGMGPKERSQRVAERMQAQEAKRQQMLARRKQRHEKETKVVSAGRWDFMFREINAETVGKDGRSDTAVGYRYGVPHEDRKKGQVKIPTRVL